jgi:hypothetical protein
MQPKETVMRHAWMLGATLTCVGVSASGKQPDTPSSAAPPAGRASPDPLVRIQADFPSALKWFGMVSDLAFDRAPDGSVTPRFETLHSRFVLGADPAGQSLGAHLPGAAHQPMEVWLTGTDKLPVADFWVRTREAGVTAAPAKIVRGVVVYAGAVSGGDLLYKLTPTHVDEYIYLRKPPPFLARTFDVENGAAVARLREAGDFLEALDLAGVARLRLSAPLARAADGVRRRGTVRVRHGQIVEEIDLRGLTAPILVDPDWTTTGTETTAHWGDAAWLRPDQQVMAVGGCALSGCPSSFTKVACAQVLGNTDLWNPTSGTWSSGPPLTIARYLYASVALPGGDFLVAGGCTETGCTATTAAAERYLYSSGAWTSAGSLSSPRAEAMAAILPNGNALIAGGCDIASATCTADVESYSTSGGGFTTLAPLPSPRGYAAATALPDGRILVTGGCSDPLCATMWDDAVLYDPVANQWSAAGSMSTVRAAHTATALPDGRVLVAGGCADSTCQTTLASAELWSPSAPSGGVFVPGPMMHASRHDHTATLLASGDVLIAGGMSASGATTSIAEVFLPIAGYWWNTTGMLMDRAYHIAVALPGGGAVVAGGCNPATCIPFAEVYSAATLPPDVDGGTAPVLDAGGSSQDAGPPPTFQAMGQHPVLYRTGETKCATATVQDLSCPQPGYGLQDGDYEPNTRALQAEGAEVLDSATGLIWQAADDGRTYTQSAAEAYCNSFSTPSTPTGVWRLPSVVELMTIDDYGVDNPSTDPLFQNTQTTNYWTSTSILDHPTLFWTVKFDAGEVIPLLATEGHAVRCVHGPSLVSGSGSMRLAGHLAPTAKFTVLDSTTGLEWQQSDDGTKRTWQESLEYCAQLSLAGESGWHLPNIYELLGLVEFVHDIHTPAIDPAFQNPKGDLYWTSSYNEGSPTLSWSVNFNLGVVDGVTVTGYGYARCVRHTAVVPGPTSHSGCTCSSEGSFAPTALFLAAALTRRRGGARRKRMTSSSVRGEPR